MERRCCKKVPDKESYSFTCRFTRTSFFFFLFLVKKLGIGQLLYLALTTTLENSCILG